jgi:putative FmdB family regulatory protein
MPTYVYRCPDCETECDVIHAMRDNPDVYCPDCHGKMKRRPQAARVNWNGHKPSGREWSPAQQEIIYGAAKRRAETVPHKNSTIVRLEREAEGLGG